MAPALRFAAAAWLLAPRLAGSQRCESQEGVDYEGHEFLWELGLTRDGCCALCSREPNCTVAVFYEAGCYLKSAFTGVSSQKEGRCALVPGRARPRVLEQPALEEGGEQASDELSFCARGYCRRDAAEPEGGALSSTTSARPQECVELESLGSGAERTEAPALWRRSARNSKLRKADLLDSGYSTSRCEQPHARGEAAPRSMLVGAKGQESRDKAASERCDILGCGSFDSSRECQCDPSCGLFENCCVDYEVECVDATAVVSAAPPAATTAAAVSTTTTPAPPAATAAAAVSATTTPGAPTTVATAAPETVAVWVDPAAAAAATTATATATVTTTSAVTSPAPTTAAPTTPTAAGTTSHTVAPTEAVARAASTSAAPAVPTTSSPDLNVTVTAPAPSTSELPPLEPTPAPPGSCRTYGCGRYWEEHACQCNAQCTRYDNCCVDYSETCTEAGRPGAGGAAASGPAAHAVGAPPPPKPKAVNAAARSCDIEKDVEFSDASGDEMGTVKSADVCASLCVSMPDCTHFSVNASEYSKICMVKRGRVGRRRKRAGAASGVCGPARASEAAAPAAGAAESADGPQPATPPAPAVPPEPLSQVSIDIFRAMKAAAADEQQTLDDDMADLLGDLKYVHTELLTEHLLDPMRQSRKYDIDCIRRQRYVFRNPAALATAVESPLPDFGPFITYDFGVATNTLQLPTLEKYGDFIGIQEGCSGGNCDVRFPAESPYFWFSVGNFCPNLPWGHKGDIDNPNAECLKYEDGSGFLTGGLCQDGWSRDQAKPSVEPTGERGCIYAYGASQVVSLDELVGITSESCGGGQKCESWADFRQNCDNAGYKKQFLASGEVEDVKYCIEYDIHPHCEASCETDACQKLLASGRTVELGLHFWRGRCDPRANLRRAEKLADLFGIEGALTEHRLLHQDVLDLQIPCVREDSGRCKPGKDAGGPYCTRSFSGVCQTCFIPGAANSEEPPSKPVCPFDIFETVDYNDSAKFPAPRCRSSNASEGCCLYAGTCAGESDPERASLDDDGLALVASRQHTGDLATFLRRAVHGNGGDADAWKAASDEAVQAAAYHQWARGFTGRTLKEALTEAEALLRGHAEESGGAWTPRSEVMFKKFLTLPRGARRVTPTGSPLPARALVLSLALVAATGACTAWRMAREGRRAPYTEVPRRPASRLFRDEVGGEAAPVSGAPPGQEAPLLRPGPPQC